MNEDMKVHVCDKYSNLLKWIRAMILKRWGFFLSALDTIMSHLPIFLHLETLWPAAKHSPQ